MAISAGNLIDRAAKILQDETNIRWLRSELLDWLNDGQREVVMYKPDASSIIASISLIAGSLQTIPAPGLKVLDITRNLGAGGSTPGRAIRITDREILDSTMPTWHTSTPRQEILHYMIDWRTPTRFYVFPPAAVPTTVEAVYAVSPTDCAGEQSALSINEIYANTLLNYMIFRAFSKDSEYAADPTQAKAYYQLFAGQVGIKAAADSATAPNTLAQTNPNVRK